MSLQDDIEGQSHDQEMSQLRGMLIRAQRKLEAAKAKTVELQNAVYQAAHDAALAHGPLLPTPPPLPDRRRRPEVALIHETDWQYGKRTDDFNMEVCEERIGRFDQKVKRITEIQRADHPVKRAHVMLGGDMLEGRGNIFPGQVHEVEAFLYDQLFGVSRLIVSTIRNNLATYEHVDVWEESGNHGRLGRKGEDAALDNADNMAYRIARDTLSEETRLTWHPQVSWHQILDIGNYRAMLAHGDEIKSYGGNVPAFGILRKCNAWASGVTAPFLDVYLGHYHQAMTLQLANGGRVFVTPSPESSNPYAQEFVAATGTPGQRLHFIDPEGGRVTSEHLIWLD
jgi:hypothetical protein